MKTIGFSGSTGTSNILINSSFNRLDDFCTAGRTVLIVDQNVLRLHEEKFRSYPVVTIRPGEQNKTLETAEKLYEELLNRHVDRFSMIVGVGGGITCDVTGFVASTFMRGVSFALVPTTLLALVDASVGGKNGVNYRGYKNLIGTFNQPGLVLADFSFLTTLPREELKNGFAEAVKHALIGNESLFGRLEEDYQGISSLDIDRIEEVVSQSLAVKIGIVTTDEKEKGERKKLNFGHTVGHAIEKAAGLTHGEAISVGMAMAGRLSEKKGLLRTTDEERIEELLKNLGLPTHLADHREAILEALEKDKKRDGGDIHFVLLNGIGRATLERIGIAELKEAVRDLC